MTRPVTLFTGQWADLPFEDACKIAATMGFEGLEIACWGDHMDVRRAAADPAYVADRKRILAKYGLQCWALGSHLAGQCVGDYNDPRLDGFAPAECKGKPDAIRAWAIDEMKYTARAAQAMGCKIVTGFMGSPIWKYFYSFPPTSEALIEAGYDEIVALWTPILAEFGKCGVKFALEVHPSEIAFDFYTSKKLFREKFAGNDTLGINFDPSHLVWQGMKPHLFIREFGDKIFHVHIKDALVSLNGTEGIIGSLLTFGDTRRGWNFVSPGHGSVDFERIIRELNAIGYDGPLSVEWEDSAMERVFGATEACAMVKKINFNPSDVAFDDAFENK
jgi:sugar phosphate isomerase/epimerase